MARYQYRVAGSLDWMSNSGNAIVAIMNPPGSGKKLTVRSFELTNFTFADNATSGTIASTLPIYCKIDRGLTIGQGTQINPEPLDTDASWPASVQVTTQAPVSGSATYTGQFMLAKQLNPATLGWIATQQIPSKFGGLRRSARRGTIVTEPWILRQGETLSIYGTNVQIPVPVRVQATLVRAGTPNRTFTVNYFTILLHNSQAIFAIDNNAGSGEIIRLIDLSVTEVGTYDSPYFQIVPVGSLDATAADGAYAEITPLKMDSNHPSPSSWMKVYKDVPIQPYGLPESALSDASAGSPKGSNYLKAKDFIGPQYRAYFPEYSALSTLRIPESLGYSNGHKNADLLMRRAAVTLREGEGIALVSAAETAAGTTAAGASGWQSWEIGVQVDIEPKYSPTLTITGLKNPSEVRIFAHNTTTEVAGQESITSGTFTWQFDPEETPSVDIAILSLGYQNIRLTNFGLSLADATIPVQQQIDRQYGNA